MADTQFALAEISPVTETARRLFILLKWLSVMKLLSLRYPILRPRSALTAAEIVDEKFIKRRGPAIEKYILGWLALEVGFAIVISSVSSPPLWVRLVFVISVSVRIVEIVQVTVNAVLFDALSGRADDLVGSRARMIVLAGVNFIELILCFGIIYASNYTKLHTAIPAMSFYVSAMTQLSIGYSNVYPSEWLRLVATIQGLVGFVFVVLVFGRFVGSLRPMRGVSDDQAAAHAGDNPVKHL